MTKTSRHQLTKALLAACALTVLAAAPAAFAAPTVDNKLYSAKQVPNYIKTADHSDRRSDRSREHRGDRSRGHRSDRHHSDRHRSDRHRSDRHRGYRSDRHRSDRGRHYRRDRGHRNYRRDYRRRDHYRPNRRHVNRNYNRQHNGYYTPYRSNVGISFNFGTPGYSRYRWSQNPYSFYRPTYGSYGYYQTSTTCRRVTVEAWHHGHSELVSVKQCSNPWDGTYIVQGSERVINCRW